LDLSAQHLPQPSVGDSLRALAVEADNRGYVYDAYGQGSSLAAFEAGCAKLLGKPAAKFFATGTAAQQACVYAHMFGSHNVPLPQGQEEQRPIIFAHPTSHLVHLDCLRNGGEQDLQFEGAAQATLPGFDVRRVGKMGAVLTFEDVHSAVATSGSALSTRSAMLIVELPQRCNGGATMAYADLCKTSEFCRREGIRLHCDGARLFDVAPFYKQPLDVLAALFDTVYLSFYKGVGALAAAVLAGEKTVIEAAGLWGKRRGADLHTRGPLSLSCEVSLDGVHNDSGANTGFAARYARLCEMVALITNMNRAAGGDDSARSIFFDPQVPESCMVHCYMRGDRAIIEQLHEQSGAETQVRLWNRFRGSGHPQPRGGDDCQAEEEWSYFEWSMGPGNMIISDADLHKGWSSFLQRYYGHPSLVQ